MTRPDSEELDELLDRCILRLQAGWELEAILADYPAQADQLRPILQALLALWSSRPADEVPMAAMADSRRRLLKAAADIKYASATPWWRISWGGFGRVWAPALIMLLCAVTLFTGIASAQALPGQVLYPVKIAAEQIGLSLPASPAGQLARVESYDLRRLDEVEELRSQQREQEVSLSGFLSHTDGDTWHVDGLQVIIPVDLREKASGLVGFFVAIHADLLGNGELSVQQIDARIYTVNGRITQVEEGRLQIDDLWIRVAPNTIIHGALAVAGEVRSSVVRLTDGSYLALRIDSNLAAFTQTLEPSATPSLTLAPEETETEVAPLEPGPTATTGDVQEPDQPDPQDSATPSPSETSKPREPEEHSSPTATATHSRHRYTPTPTPKRESTESEEEHRSTPTATKTKTRTPTPTVTPTPTHDSHD